MLPFFPKQTLGKFEKEFFFFDGCSSSQKNKTKNIVSLFGNAIHVAPVLFLSVFSLAPLHIQVGNLFKYITNVSQQGLWLNAQKKKVHIKTSSRYYHVVFIICKNTKL